MALTEITHIQGRYHEVYKNSRDEEVYEFRKERCPPSETPINDI